MKMLKKRLLSCLRLWFYIGCIFFIQIFNLNKKLGTQDCSFLAKLLNNGIFSFGIAKILQLEGTSGGPSSTPNPDRIGLGPIRTCRTGPCPIEF